MLAIIPARSGSKGLPGKNIKNFAGLPLIAHTIKAALDSQYITSVIVSTDSEEIYQIAVQHGADRSFLRPAELAQDDSLAVDTYLYTIERLSAERKEDISEVVILQPTSPLRNTEDIDGAIKLFKEKNADSVIAYTQEHHPIAWHKYLQDDLSLENIFPDSIDNRQKHKPSYYPNGAVYVFKTSLLKKKKYYSDSTFAYVMPRLRSIDIDTMDDFLYAEFVSKSYES